MNSSTKTITREGIVTTHLSKTGSIFLIKGINSVGKPERLRVISKQFTNAPKIGELWSIEGVIDNNEKYGMQLLASTLTPKLPGGKILVYFLASNNKFQGIGKTKAERLWTTFGESLYDILNNNDIEKLTDKHGGNLSNDLACTLVDSWSEYSNETKIVKFLQENDFPVRLARRIREFWSKDTINIIQNDPYKMLAFCNWVTVDTIAVTKFNINPHSEIRLAAACEASIYDEYDKKNTAVIYTKLKKLIKKKISDCDPDKAIEYALNDKRIVEIDKNKYQGYGQYALEKFIADRLRSINAVEETQKSLFPIKYDDELLSKFEDENSILLNGTYKKIRLHKQQRLAVERTLNSPFSLILGGAGVGKTTVLKAVYSQLPQTTIVYQIALSGRTAVRMQEATEREAMTIAKFLNIAKDNKLPENFFLFIDEASILDEPTFYRILKYLPSGSRLCLIGDHYQLPPIGPGLVFHALAGNKNVPQTELEKVHRSTESTGLPSIAKTIRSQKVPSFKKYEHVTKCDLGASFLEAEIHLNDAYKDTLLSSISSLYWDCLERGSIQIVAGTLSVCNAINVQLHNNNIELREMEKLKSPLIKGQRDTVTIGDAIVYVDRNDYERELYNGSIGILTNIYDHPQKAITSKDEEIEYIAEAYFDTSGLIQITTEDMEYIKLGYSITLHKAQGSQWERVIVISHPTRAKGFIDNTWFYTAITRASKQVYIIGDYSIFKSAVASTPTSFNREIGLKV